LIMVNNMEWFEGFPHDWCYQMSECVISFIMVLWPVLSQIYKPFRVHSCLKNMVTTYSTSKNCTYLFDERLTLRSYVLGDQERDLEC